jgi:hypothetical protein
MRECNGVTILSVGDRQEVNRKSWQIGARTTLLAAVRGACNEHFGNGKEKLEFARKTR